MPRTEIYIFHQFFRLFCAFHKTVSKLYSEYWRHCYSMMPVAISKCATHNTFGCTTIFPIGQNIQDSLYVSLDTRIQLFPHGRTFDTRVPNASKVFVIVSTRADVIHAFSHSGSGIASLRSRISPFHSFSDDPSVTRDG